jgi:peptidoglycan hydrolase-like protein with peptidoglycan-binding domain
MRFKEFKLTEDEFANLDKVKNLVSFDMPKNSSTAPPQSPTPDASTVVKPATVANPSGFTVSKPAGNQGSDIADLQKALIALGYPLPSHGVDGIRGPETANAVRKFQQDNALVSNGIPNDETIAKINSELTTRPEVAKSLTKSTSSDVKPNGPSQTVGTMDTTSATATAAKQSAGKFLGRELDDNEWNYLIRATTAEASPNTKEQAYVMAVILNRTRSGKWGSSVIDVLQAKNQFQAVTGTRKDPGPSSNFARGPSKAQLASIFKGTIEILPSVSTSLMNFTAASSAAYGPGTNIGYRDKLLAIGGQQIGGTIFA